MRDFFILLCCVFVFLTGCGRHDDASYQNSEPQERLKSILKKENGLNSVVKRIGQTLWVYIPLKKTIMGYGVKEIPKRSKPKPFTLLYSEGTFANRTFIITYDIVPSTQSGEPQGLSGIYTEDFNTAYRSSFSAIMRAFHESENPPTFLVVVISDILTGIEARYTLTFEDLKKQSLNALPQESYVRRVLYESRGHPDIVGDWQGRYLDIRDLSWGEFLARQMEHRIKFAYQLSDFPPEESHKDVIAGICAQTVSDYDFRNFEELRLVDWRDSGEIYFSQQELLSFHSSF